MQKRKLPELFFDGPCVSALVHSKDLIIVFPQRHFLLFLRVLQTLQRCSAVAVHVTRTLVVIDGLLKALKLDVDLQKWHRMNAQCKLRA
jgi:hypothetical protein